MTPPLKFYHGDLLLRNVLVEKDMQPLFIDIRGKNIHRSTPDKINLGYEMGKILHSFGCEAVRRKAIHVKFDLRDGEAHFMVQEKDPQLVKKLTNIRTRFLESLQKNVFGLAKNQEDSLSLVFESLLSESVHFLTDAVNRLLNDPTGEDTLAFYALGSKKLAECMSMFETLTASQTSTYTNTQHITA
jgi:hypothetical protein